MKTGRVNGGLPGPAIARTRNDPDHKPDTACIRQPGTATDQKPDIAKIIFKKRSGNPSRGKFDPRPKEISEKVCDTIKDPVLHIGLPDFTIIQISG